MISRMKDVPLVVFGNIEISKNEFFNFFETERVNNFRIFMKVYFLFLIFLN